MLDFLPFGRQKNRNYLEMTPYRLCDHENNDGGTLTILVPRFPGKILGKFLQSKAKKPYIRANLDEFGSAVWLQVDGVTNVETIGIKLREQYGDKVDPVYDRLTFFLTQLYKSGLISFNELTKGN